MLAVHLENLLFLLLLVVAGLFQLLGRAARKGSTEEEKPKSTPLPRARKPIPRAPVESDQERIRKFLEALGQPPASSPPSPVAPRPTYRKPLVLPRVPPIGSPLPPLVTRPPDVPHEIQIPAQTVAPAVEQRQARSALVELEFQVHEAEASPEPAAAVSAATFSEGRTQPEIAAPQNIDVKTLLRSTLRLRDAIVVREILGPPRGLPELELP